MSPAVTLRDTAEGCILPVRVHPGARRNDVTGILAGALKISLKAPPTDGRANEALISLIAGRLQISRAQITLLSGASSRSKVLLIAGKRASAIVAAFAELA